MPVGVARNTAINLDRQYNFMSNLKESQMATALNNFTPENMLRLVRLNNKKEGRVKTSLKAGTRLIGAISTQVVQRLQRTLVSVSVRLQDGKMKLKEKIV